MLQSDDTFTWDVERTSCRCSVALVQHVSVFITEEFETFKTNWVRKEKRTVQNSTAARQIWSLKLHCDFIHSSGNLFDFSELWHVASLCLPKASRPESTSEWTESWRVQNRSYGSVSEPSVTSSFSEAASSENKLVDPQWDRRAGPNTSSEKCVNFYPVSNWAKLMRRRVWWLLASSRLCSWNPSETPKLTQQQKPCQLLAVS